MTVTLGNISLTTLQKFLEFKGLRLIRTSGGHEIWSRQDLLRPVVIQSHITPVPEFIIRNILRTIGSNKAEIVQFIEEN